VIHEYNKKVVKMKGGPWYLVLEKNKEKIFMMASGVEEMIIIIFVSLRKYKKYILLRNFIIFGILFSGQKMIWSKNLNM
jgi:hypothetical protein